MALEYGADLVYTPEVVDKAIIGAERIVNGKKKMDIPLGYLWFLYGVGKSPKGSIPLTTYPSTLTVEDNGTIDYVLKGVSVFRTHPSEKSKLVFQIGSANADLALQAALTV